MTTPIQPDATRRSISLLGILCALALAGGPAAAEHSLSDHYVRLAIQGDLRPAVPLFARLDAAAPAAELALAEQFRARFVPGGETHASATGEFLVDEAVAAYRAYWRDTLVGDGPPERAEAELVSRLRSALPPRRTVAGSPGEIYRDLVAALESSGYRALADQAAPLQDLFIWRGQELREFRVELTDETRAVRVAFLSDFAVQGWKHYASLGLATTTGWVEGETLYCVEWAYDTDSENFRVSYLQHEARHLADFERFPGLDSRGLEYRAKLTELAFATSTLPRLLEDFRSKAAPNPDSPHAAANHRLVQELGLELFGSKAAGEEAWIAARPAAVNRAARRLLVRDTERLERGAVVDAGSPGR